MSLYEKYKNKMYDTDNELVVEDNVVYEVLKYNKARLSRPEKLKAGGTTNLKSVGNRTVWIDKNNEEWVNVDYHWFKLRYCER